MIILFGIILISAFFHFRYKAHLTTDTAKNVYLIYKDDFGKWKFIMIWGSRK
jgi:hypothetical protein